VKLNLSRLQKKLAEAAFFLGKLMKQEQRLTGHREPFDYYLSAFLSAGMSFRDGFQIRQDRPRNTAIKTWRAQWENNLTSEEKSLYDFMQKDRVDEVHYSGRRRITSGSLLAVGFGRFQHASTFSCPTQDRTGRDMIIVRAAAASRLWWIRRSISRSLTRARIPRTKKGRVPGMWRGGLSWGRTFART
jgi:hypothetical protein